ncbi:MAG: hypothetical protein LC802_08990 [Acidobacteria bacterium]|nr:hypothetical protein [Acidobacteriota bacterium]
MGADEPQVEAKVEFVAPVSVDDALAIAAWQNLKVTQIQHSFTIGKEKFVGFYVVDADDTPATIAPNLAANYRAFLQDIADPAEENIPDAGPSDPIAGGKLKQRRVQAKQALTRSYQDELRVVGITVVGEENQLDAVKDAPLVSKVTAEPSEQEQISTKSLSKGDAPPQAATNVDENTWVPVSGRIITAPSSAGGRYVEQQMKWSNVSGFGPNSTYEHDFFLKNSAGTVRGPGTYLDRSETRIDRIPIVAYATSNLPRAYLDSRFKDGTDEIAFTIGCAKASDIKVGETYTSYIRTKDGDASQDDGKLQAQLGHRTPSWCYDTLCSFEDEQVSRVVIVPAWEVPVPGVKAWDRTRAPVAHFSMSAQGKSANDFGTLNLSVPVNGNVTVAFRSTSVQGSWPITKYLWKSNGTQICTNSSTCNYNFGTASNTITLTVTDSSGKSMSASGLVKLSFFSVNPSVSRFRYSPNPAKATRVVSLDIYGSSFSSNTQVWFVGPGCGSPGCRTFAVNAPNSGYIAAQAVLNITGTYTVNIRNGSGAWVRAGTITVVR